MEGRVCESGYFASHHLESWLNGFDGRCQRLLVPILGDIIRDDRAMVMEGTIRILLGNYDVDGSNIGTWRA